MRSAFVLPGSCPLLVRWCPLHWPVIVLYLSGNCAVYPLHTPFVRASSSNGYDFHHRIIFFRKVSIRRTSVNAIRQGVTAPLWGCHTLPNSINGRPTESKIVNPFVCVSCPFLVRRMRSLSGEVRSIRRKFCACTKLGTDSTGHAFCSELVRSSSCTCQFASVDVRWT